MRRCRVGHDVEDCGVSSFMSPPVCVPNIGGFLCGRTDWEKGLKKDIIYAFFENRHPMGCCLCGDLKEFWNLE